MNPNDFFSGLPNNLECLFCASWSCWEEAGWCFIFFDKDNNYFYIDGGDSPGYRADNYIWEKHSRKISEQEVLLLIDEWSENEDEYEI